MRHRLAGKRKHGDGEESGEAQMTFEERRRLEQRRYRRADLWHGGGATCKPLGAVRAPTALSATASSSSSGGGGGEGGSNSSININALGAAHPQNNEGAMAGPGEVEPKQKRTRGGRGGRAYNQHVLAYRRKEGW